jgi:hypothetical protein
MPVLNLLDFLSADHQHLLEAASPTVLDVSQHLSVERDFLYAAISEHIADGEAIVAGLRQAERRLEEHLRDFEKQATPRHREELQAAIGDHVTVQEDQFGRFRELIPESALVFRSEVIALSIGGAPTHAHPNLAHGGLIGELIEDVTSAADHMRDHLHDDKDAERPPQD